MRPLLLATTPIATPALAEPDYATATIAMTVAVLDLLGPGA